MPALKPEYEAFCQAYLINSNATRAARDAGYAPDHAHQQGYRLLRRAPIVRRLAQLRTELVERECLTPDALLAKLETAFQAAMKKDQPIAAARIVEAQAKLAALVAKTGAAGAGGDAQRATRAAVAQMAKQLGLPAPQFDAR
ncbi:MAG: phage terminase, small subunit [Rhodospirillales bacterium]|jgi:phage terminase small subunit|nr:phage terminase, small subunit [Rhodospirillales bacterium]